MTAMPVKKKKKLMTTCFVLFQEYRLHILYVHSIYVVIKAWDMRYKKMISEKLILWRKPSYAWIIIKYSIMIKRCTSSISLSNTTQSQQQCKKCLVYHKHYPITILQALTNATFGMAYCELWGTWFLLLVVLLTTKKIYWRPTTWTMQTEIWFVA